MKGQKARQSFDIHEEEDKNEEAMSMIFVVAPTSLLSQVGTPVELLSKQLYQPSSSY